MTVTERKKVILDKIEELKAEGVDLKEAIAKFGVTDNE